MENVKDSRDVETRKIKTKGARGISLRACVAKAAGWTLEKANATSSQEASINKISWLWMMWMSPDMEATFHTTLSYKRMHVILKTITRTRTLKGGGFGLTDGLWAFMHFHWSKCFSSQSLVIVWTEPKCSIFTIMLICHVEAKYVQKHWFPNKV